METREQRGLLLAATKKITQKKGLWIVPSQTGHGSYVVDPTDGSCSCPDHFEHRTKCKHVFAVEFVVKRETAPDGSVTVTEQVTVTRKTYTQDWTAYNLSQTEERPRVLQLLKQLCDGVAEPPRKTGRRGLPMGDRIFCSAMKVFDCLSARRSKAGRDDLAEKGLISRVPHYNSVLRYIEDERMTPVLRELVMVTAAPLASIDTEDSFAEDSFAIDATGFATSTYTRWFVEKRRSGGYADDGLVEAPKDDTRVLVATSRQDFVKLHVSVSTRTHIVAAAVVTPGNVHDSPVLPGLVEATVRYFKPKEIAADKGYLANDNFAAIEAVGATPYLMFKKNSRGDTGIDSWRRMFHLFQAERESFLAHYHKRSNVESVFSMIKRIFGSAVRSKSDTAKTNEVLLKVLCHNLRCLVKATFELGLAPLLWVEPRQSGAAVEIEGVAS